MGRSHMRPLALWLLTRLTVAAAADALSFCQSLSDVDLPSADFSACGLATRELWGYNSNLYTEKKCTNAACQRLVAFVTAANPTECYIGRGQPVGLYATVLDPLKKACAALANPTPAPAPGPVPVPVPVPGPGPGPAPAPSPAPPLGTTPVPATPSPSSAPTSSARPGATTASPTVSDPPSSSMPGVTDSPMPSLHRETTPAPSTAEKDASPSATSIPSRAASSDVSKASSPSNAPSAPGSGSSDVVVSTPHTSGSSTSWVVGTIAALAVVIVAVFMFAYRRRLRDRSAKLTTGTATTAASNDEYHDIDAINAVPIESRHQMDAMLRDDHVLASWRLFSQHTADRKLLGKGSHAFVHLVELSNGTLLAAKRLARDQATPKHLAQLLAEVHIVTTLSHASIVQFKGVTWTNAMDIQVLFEYMEGGDLRAYLDTLSPCGWTQHKLEIATSVAEGLVYAHSFNAPLVHRDLKSHNILLTRKLQAKISDFGVARFQSENDTMTTGVGTNRWLAPEVLAGGGVYNEKCDIYSFGVVMTELDSHEAPLDKQIEALRASRTGERSQSELWVLRKIAKGTLRPTMSSLSPSEVRELVMRCLSFNPNDRPDALELSFRLRKLVGGKGKTKS